MALHKCPFECFASPASQRSSSLLDLTAQWLLLSAIFIFESQGWKASHSRAEHTSLAFPLGAQRTRPTSCWPSRGQWASSSATVTQILRSISVRVTLRRAWEA